MRVTSGRVGHVIGTLAVISLLPLSVEAQQLGNAVNSAKTVANKVVPLAKKAAPVANKAVQTVRGNGSAKAPAPSASPRRAPPGAPPG